MGRPPAKHGECDLWRDNAVGIVGPGGAALPRRRSPRRWHYIDARRARSGGAEFTYDISGERAAAATMVRRARQRPDASTARCARILHAAVPQGASTASQLTMAYFAPDDDLIDELCSAASRGVRVRLMLPGRCDVQPLLIAARVVLRDAADRRRRDLRAAGTSSCTPRRWSSTASISRHRLDQPRLPQHRVQPGAVGHRSGRRSSAGR